MIAAQPINNCVSHSCDAIKGVVTKAKVCAEGPACTITHCDIQRGCVHEPVLCQVSPGSCASYKCNPSTDKCEIVIPDCDDHNPCTVDSFDVHSGCTHTPKCVAKDLCTISSCGPTGQCSYSAKNCNDGNLCTVDSCDLCTGACLHTPITCSCGSGNVGTCNPQTAECEIRKACSNNSDCPSDGNPSSVPVCTPVGCTNLIRMVA